MCGKAKSHAAREPESLLPLSFSVGWSSSCGCEPGGQPRALAGRLAAGEKVKDLRSPKLMVVKAALFLALALLCTAGLWLQSPGIRTALLALVLAWSASRLYYFLFYVLHAYVDPRLRYAGLLALLRALREHRSCRPARQLPAASARRER